MVMVWPSRTAGWAARLGTCGALSMLALILLGTVFWRVADAVAVEWNAARYNRDEENFQN